MASKFSETDIKKKIDSYINTITFENKIISLAYNAVLESDGTEFSKFFKCKLIDNKTIHNIILETTSNTIYSDKKILVDENTKSLGDIKTIKIADISTKVFNLLKKLPINYDFIFPLQTNKDKLITTSLKLTNNIDLLLITDNDSKKFNNIPTSEKLFHPTSKDLEKDNTAIQIKSRGFVSIYGITKLLSEDPLYLFKIIIGIYIATDILRVDDKSYTGQLGISREFSYRVFNKNNYVTTLRESSEDAHFMSSLVLLNESFKPNLYDYTSKNISKFEKTNRDLRKILNIYKFQKNKPKGLDPTATKKIIKDKEKLVEHGFQIRNGAYWYYESMKSNQPHSEIIYLVTAFDSLLGNISEKFEKAETVAYTIANSAMEVEIIKDYIANLYELRNKIIHGKEALYKLLDYNQKVEIEKHPLVLKFTCQSYLKRYIQKRLTLLSQSIADS